MNYQQNNIQSSINKLFKKKTSKLFYRYLFILLHLIKFKSVNLGVLDFLWIMPFNKKSLQITKAAKHNIAFEHLRKYIFLYVIKFINIPFMSIQNQLKIYMHNKCLFCLFAAYFLKANCEIIIYIQGIKIYITQILNTTHWGCLEWRREYEGEKQNVNGVDNGLGFLLLLHV